MERVTIYNHDCVEIMAHMPANSVDSIPTDPPYGLRYMNKGFDKLGDGAAQREWHIQWAREALRVLKPGGHVAAFGGSRTYHHLASALEEVGFEIRDGLQWMYGQGFPKSMNLAKQKQILADPELLAEWQGWGTALKPGYEPIVLARKSLDGTVVENVLKWRTGALNIRACRISTEADGPGEGRWPANVIMDPEAGAVLDGQTQHLRIGGHLNGGEGGDRAGVSNLELGPRGPWEGYGDSGGASRFFYCPKTGRKERDLGCEHLPERTGGEATDREDGSAGTNSPRAGAGRTGGSKNIHPTVKPVALMRWLIKLITPPTGMVLDPFLGSGTTGIAARLEDMDFIGVEKDTENGYVEIARTRISAWKQLQEDAP